MTAAKPTAAPVVISDVTSLAIVGLNGRQFRAALRQLGVPHGRIGRRTVCRVDAWLAAIDALTGSAPAARVPWDEDAVVRAAARGSR